MGDEGVDVFTDSWDFADFDADAVDLEGVDDMGTMMNGNGFPAGLDQFEGPDTLETPQGSDTIPYYVAANPSDTTTPDDAAVSGMPRDLGGTGDWLVNAGKNLFQGVFAAVGVGSRSTPTTTKPGPGLARMNSVTAPNNMGSAAQSSMIVLVVIVLGALFLMRGMRT